MTDQIIFKVTRADVEFQLRRKMEMWDEIRINHQLSELFMQLIIEQRKIDAAEAKEKN